MHLKRTPRKKFLFPDGNKKKPCFHVHFHAFDGSLILTLKIVDTDVISKSPSVKNQRIKQAKKKKKRQ